MTGRAPASESTRAANRAVLDQLPFEDRTDFEDAMRGFIAPLGASGKVMKGGFPLWDVEAFAFIEDGSEAPESVNPSLWRQSQLCLKGGLFQVTDRMYQVRNADI